jgi:hypothetical protein
MHAVHRQIAVFELKVSMVALAHQPCVCCLQFGTDFKTDGRRRGTPPITRHLWLDKSLKTTEVPTLVMDLEGSSGRERGG